MKKSIIILLLGVLLLTNLNTLVLAANNNNQIVVPYWVNTASIDGDLYTNGSTGNISAVIIGNSNVTQITAQATLYYKNTSNKWVKTTTDWEFSSNSSILAIDEDFSAVSGRTYKVVLEVDVYANGYTETITREFF